MAGRRGHGEGSVFRRDADGKWLAVLELGRDPRTGRRIRRTVTAPTRREVDPALVGARRLPAGRHCQRLLDEGLAPSSVAKVVQVLRMMLDHAVREGAIVTNPVARAQVPRKRLTIS